MNLLKQLCAVQAPSGGEISMKNFLLNYIVTHAPNWKMKPTILEGPPFQDCIILVFGKPRTAVFSHMDSVGFTVRYEDQLIPIGSPDIKDGYVLVGNDELGPIECKLKADKKNGLRYQFGRSIQRGTNLVFKHDFRETQDYITSCFLDNRVGIYNCLKLAETLTHGAICFTCWEEHGGGSVPYLLHYLYEHYQIKNALVSDITWVTDGILPGNGVVISLRDRNIPRQSFIKSIVDVARASQIAYQLEVEDYGSSDGREIQMSPYPVDWCFIGAPHRNAHSPDETIHRKDLQSMIDLYNILLKEL